MNLKTATSRPLLFSLLAVTLPLLSVLTPNTSSADSNSYLFGVDDRIPVDFGKFPWLGQLVSRLGQFRGRCSGTLVSPTLVLTAGHCFSEVEGGGDEIVGKRTSFFLQQSALAARADAGGVVIAGFNQWMGFLTRHMDWALVRLDRPMIGGTYPEVVGLEPSTDTKNLVVSWYGYPADLSNGERAFVHENCRSGDWMGGTDAFFTYCDSAKGQSGGPVTARIGGKEVIVGIVSGGFQHSFFGFNFAYNPHAELETIRRLIEADLIAYGVR